MILEDNQTYKLNKEPFKKFDKLLQKIGFEKEEILIGENKNQYIRIDYIAIIENIEYTFRVFYFENDVHMDLRQKFKPNKAGFVEVSYIQNVNNFLNTYHIEGNNNNDLYECIDYFETKFKSFIRTNKIKKLFNEK